MKRSLMKMWPAKKTEEHLQGQWREEMETCDDPPCGAQSVQVGRERGALEAER